MTQYPQMFLSPNADTDRYEDMQIMLIKHNETTKKIKSTCLRIAISTVVLLILTLVGSALVLRMKHVPYEVLKRTVFYPVLTFASILFTTIIGSIVVHLCRGKQLKQLEAQIPLQTELQTINS